MFTYILNRSITKNSKISPSDTSLMLSISSRNDGDFGTFREKKAHKKRRNGQRFLWAFSFVYTLHSLSFRCPMFCFMINWPSLIRLKQNMGRRILLILRRMFSKIPNSRSVAKVKVSVFFVSPVNYLFILYRFIYKFYK